MLHLFNKVYVASDSIISLDFDRIVISQENGNSMYEPLEKVSHGILINCSKSVEDIFEKQNFSNFIQDLNDRINSNDKKIIIYLDDDNFCKFMSIWFKSIFQNPTSSSCWKIIYEYLLKERVIRSWEYSYISSDFQVFSSVNEEKFSNYFLQSDAFDIENIKSTLSFEVLLASYLYDGSNKNELKLSLSNILKRTMQELLLDVKKTYKKNYKKSVFPKLLVEDDFFSNSSLYLSETVGKVGNLSLVDIIDATSVDINKFKQVAKHILIEWEEFKEDSFFVQRVDFLDMIKRDMTDEDLNILLNFEKISKNNIRLYSSTDEEKINYYFLDFILNSDTSNLINYALK